MPSNPSRRPPRSRRVPLEPTTPEERRSSSRAPAHLRVSQGPACWIEECEGDVGLGGVRWRTSQAPHRSEVEVRLQLPESPEELLVPGRVLHTRTVGTWTEVHARFQALDASTEHALARFLEDSGARASL